MTKKKAKETKMPFPSTKKAKAVSPKSSPFGLNLLWIVLLILLVVPLINQLNTNGTAPNAAKAEPNPFSLTRWFNSAFQKRAEDNVKQTWAFKDQLTKFNNDFDFYLFNKCNVNGFVLGKDNYIYSEGYIEAYLGRDYVGEDSIAKKIKMFKALQDTLKKHNVDIVMVYAPDKASFFPEYLSSKYNVPRTHTNYEDFVKLSKQYGINYIDMEKWFLSMKDTSRYKLFPQFGHHWSYYGGCIAADSLIKYMSSHFHITFPYFGWKDVSMGQPQGRDDDIWKKMNVTFEPSTYPMAYPNIQYGGDPGGNHRVLGIGDSYYRDFLMDGAMQNVFGDGRYWYYYNKVYPESDRQLLEVWELDMKKEIESSRAIVILGSDGYMSAFGWGFIEDAYQLYTNPKAFYEKKQAAYKLNYYKKQIRGNTQLLDELKNQAAAASITLDSMINQTAHTMMREADNKQNQ